MLKRAPEGIFSKKSKMKKNPLMGRFWDLEIFGKFIIFDFCFLALNGRKYVETCSPEGIFAKKSKMKKFPLGKIQNFRFLFFCALNGGKYVETCSPEGIFPKNQK